MYVCVNVGGKTGETGVHDEMFPPPLSQLCQQYVYKTVAKVYPYLLLLLSALSICSLCLHYG